jgi:hypothetical protein
MRRYFFLFSLTGICLACHFAQAGDQPCINLVNKELDKVHYGTFFTPKSPVSKIAGRDGAAVFQSPGGPQIIVQQDRIDSSERLMGIMQISSVKFDVDCNVTSVTISASNGMPGFSSFAQADAKSCSLARSPFQTRPGTLSDFNKVLLSSLCQQYFPTAEKPPGDGGNQNSTGNTAK